MNIKTNENGDICFAQDHLKHDKETEDIGWALGMFKNALEFKEMGNFIKYAYYLKLASQGLARAAETADAKNAEAEKLLSRPNCKRLFEEIAGMGLLERYVRDSIKSSERIDGVKDTEKRAQYIYDRIAKLKAEFPLASPRRQDLPSGDLGMFQYLVFELVSSLYVSKSYSERQLMSYEAASHLMRLFNIFDIKKAGDINGELDKEV